MNRFKDIIIIVLISCILVLAYFLYKNNSKKCIEVSEEEKYKLYVNNYKKSMNNLNSNNEQYRNIKMINSEVVGSYTLMVNTNNELILNQGGKYEDYVMAKDVVNFFIVDEGNGGFNYVYYTTLDGSLYTFCVEMGEQDIEKLNFKYIVNVIDNNIEYSIGDDGCIPLFIDILGNVYSKY